jgi:asparagine synthase (glutamine-hydrolysing)
MLSVLRHESFYVSSTLVDESLGLYVGWTAMEATLGAEMPVRAGGATLVFSGEEYSKSEVTAAWLMERVRETEFPANLNGLFHGMLADKDRGTVTLFNDRYGMHRLYYHEAAEGFYFAAEAKAILAVRPELRTPSLKGIGEFISLSCVLENRTIFDRLFVLPAASAWTFEAKRLTERRSWFDPAVWEQQEKLTPQAHMEDLQAALRAALPAYFAGPQAVGVALTGGMDTRVLMSQHAEPAGSLACYTFGGPYRDCQDVLLARRVAQACGHSHQVIEVGEEYLKNFPRYAERAIELTEGAVDVYRASDLYVSERARLLAPVKVVGTYGSEIVRHAVMFKPMPPDMTLLDPSIAGHVRAAAATYAAVRAAHPVTFAAFRQSPWYHHGILHLEQTQLTVRSPFLDNRFVKAVYRAPELTADDVRMRLIRAGSPALAKIPTDRGLGGDRGPLAGWVANQWLEFTFKAEYAYDYGMPQPVALVDHALSALHLERLFLGRHKFLHYRVWYRDALAPYIREVLLDSRTLSRPWIHAPVLRAQVESHLAGTRNYTTTIHKMLTLELLQRRFFDAR